MAKRVDIMLDIETLGKKPGCAIVQIAAGIFDIERPAYKAPHTFSSRIRVDAQNNVEEASTMSWWADQPTFPLLKTGTRNLADVLYSLNGFIIDAANDRQAQREDIRIWCQGTDFDIPILKAAYDRAGVPMPTHYRSPRDTRTLFDAAGYEPNRSNITHDALEDVHAQIGWVKEAWRRLRSPYLLR